MPHPASPSAMSARPTGGSVETTGMMAGAGGSTDNAAVLPRAAGERVGRVPLGRGLLRLFLLFELAAHCSLVRGCV